ncbi:hypothetical protein QVD17_37210 [Tagetes erecta]|uniref:Uncharacterized protein n=1 Tax=Tagetes erecta TaxID=13708 RepID=A0AAD8NJM8_TARER|nr:hypothetical protein QVD17_37210 [Tagetes erecta]
MNMFIKKGIIFLGVAQRSYDFVENCDFPSPQDTSFKRDVYARDRSPQKKDEVSASVRISLPQKHQCQNAASPIASSGSFCPLRTKSIDNTVNEGSKTHEMDPNNRKLLEALCHSQTRARVAEKAAKQAYEEKEHIVNTFAYKQWQTHMQTSGKSDNARPIAPSNYVAISKEAAASHVSAARLEMVHWFRSLLVVDKALHWYNHKRELLFRINEE